MFSYICPCISYTLSLIHISLTGNGVHVVTVNDYLSKRDSEWMGPLYQFHGLSVDGIDKHQPNSDARRRAYMADITFGTNNEFGFDYLRDNMAVSPKDSFLAYQLLPFEFFLYIHIVQILIQQFLFLYLKDSSLQ